MTTCNPGQETVPNALISKISIGDILPYIGIRRQYCASNPPTLPPPTLYIQSTPSKPPTLPEGWRVGGLASQRVGGENKWRGNVREECGRGRLGLESAWISEERTRGCRVEVGRVGESWIGGATCGNPEWSKGCVKKSSQPYNTTPKLCNINHSTRFARST